MFISLLLAANMARATTVVASLATKGATTETTIATFRAVARNVTSLATLNNRKLPMSILYENIIQNKEKAYAVASRTTAAVITGFRAITGL